MSVEVRSFERRDRDQLTALVNAHVAAVVPGLMQSVNTILAQLEREPDEFVVDPWVRVRRTLVAEQRGRIVAAAHLLRYGGEASVSDSYRDVGEIRWFLFWPQAPFWPDTPEAADMLLAACVAQLEAWGAARQEADGTLPAPGVCGIPEQWPHVRAALERAGFEHRGRTEVVWLAEVTALASADAAPIAGVELRRSLDVNGTRLAAALKGETVGFIEVATLNDAGRNRPPRAFADIGNLEVVESFRGSGIGSWLVAQAAGWLRLAGVDSLLAYSNPDEDACGAFFARTAGFHELTRTARGWWRMS